MYPTRKDQDTHRLPEAVGIEHSRINTVPPQLSSTSELLVDPLPPITCWRLSLCYPKVSYAATDMGQKPSSPLATCLDNVCDGRSSCVGYSNDPLYQINWVKPYNLDLAVVPIAVTRPETKEDVAGFVKCAADNSVKVQAKSGGHSYAYVVMPWPWRSSLALTCSATNLACVVTLASVAPMVP